MSSLTIATNIQPCAICAAGPNIFGEVFFPEYLRRSGFSVMRQKPDLPFPVNEVLDNGGFWPAWHDLCFWTGDSAC
ncbi:hypothetical protein GYA97_25705 [Escherichia coli]|nr:hypothetical protein [Escherichia coli]